MIDTQLEQEIDLLHSRICQALADPKRILILYILARGARNVGDIVDELNVPQSTVSRHLAVLRERGLISGEREGTAVYYSLVDERIIDALDLMRAVLATQLTARADLVQPSH
jgi:DNA-binding transcriptional ArsR family regulator